MRISDWSSDVCSSDLAFAVRKVHLEITDHGDMARRDQEAREVAGSVIGVRRYTTHVHEDCIGRVDINPVFVISGAVPVRNRVTIERTASDRTHPSLDRKSTRLNSSH